MDHFCPTVHSQLWRIRRILIDPRDCNDGWEVEVIARELIKAWQQHPKRSYALIPSHVHLITHAHPWSAINYIAWQAKQ